MKLHSFSYKQNHDENKNDWIINKVNLDCLNLIVGKNAIGKSRILRIISAFTEIFNQEAPVYWGDWNFNFISSDNKFYEYFLKSSFNSIEEKLMIDNVLKLERLSGIAKVYSEIEMNNLEISPPKDKLVMHIRRDRKEFPFFEELISWSENTHFFKFGYIHPNSFLESNKSQKKGLSTIEDIPKLLNDLDEYTKENIITEFNQIGYKIEKLFLNKTIGKESLNVKESFLKYPISQNMISQGMFRALTLILFINYLIFTKKVKTLIVDDLCEGLDYERATKLGKLLFSKMKKENLQFVASTNDSFLMDAVDIKYWNVLKRDGNKTISYNYKKNKEKFDNFKYTGLSNFDFFSSDYLNEIKKQ
jgi:hypothetical protein